IKDIKKIDDHTVQFVLSHPDAPFIANMAMEFASILSKEYGDYLIKKKAPEQIDTHPIGTGPFVFQKYVKDTLIRYQKHKDYFEGKQKLDKLVFAMTPVLNLRTQELKIGECHLIDVAAPTDLDNLRKANNVEVMVAPGLNIGYLAFNTEK